MADTADTTIARISNIDGDQDLDAIGIDGQPDDDIYEEARAEVRDAIKFARTLRGTYWVDPEQGDGPHAASVTVTDAVQGLYWVVWQDGAAWIADGFASVDDAEADYERQVAFATGTECFGPADQSDSGAATVLPEGYRRERDETGIIQVVTR